MHYKEHHDPADAPDGLEAAGRLTMPYFLIDFDFRLAVV